MLDITNIPLEVLTEKYLNQLLGERWEMGLETNSLRCTMAQKRKMQFWCKPVPLKRTLLDRVLFRTRWSDGTLRVADKSAYSVNVYQSDFGNLNVEV